MRVAICAIIKDEHRYLKEWIDWNLNIGFNEIHLFEDYGSKSHKEIVREYDNVYLHSITECGATEDMRSVNNKACIRQHMLYEWFAKSNVGKIDWCAFIDVDEYIATEDGTTLLGLLEEFKDKEGIYLYWKMKGASGHAKRPEGSVVENYTEDTRLVGGDQSWDMKSVVNLNKYKGIHSIHQFKELYNTAGLQTARIRCFKKAWINHYFTKSWEDWIERFLHRGDLVWGHRKIDDFFFVNTSMLPMRDELMKWFNDKRFENNTKCVKNDAFEIDCELPSFDTNKKRLLFVGNKDSNNISANGYDIVVRYNKIDGYDVIPRTDVYMLYGVPSHFVKNVSRERLDNLHNIPIIYVNRQWYEYHSKEDPENTDVMLPQNILKRVRLWSDKEVVEGLGIRYTTDDMEHFQSAIRTILFLLWKYGDEYSITIANIDIERSFVAANPFHDRWEEEERLLYYLIYNDKIRLL